MALYLRQIALVARELDPVVAELCSVLGLEIGFRDPGVAAFGLHNAVLPVGDTFLEVVSPVQDGTTAGRLLDRRGGDGGYMVILQTDDLARERARMQQLGVRMVWEVELEGAAAIHLHPRDVGGALLSFDWMDPPESWRWAGPDWKSHVRSDVSAELVGVEIQSSDPAKTAGRWAAVLGAPARVHGEEHVVPLARGQIRFAPERDGRGEGVSAFDVRTVDPDHVLKTARRRGIVSDSGDLEICGTRIRVI